MEENKIETTELEKKVNEAFNTADTTSEYDPEDINKNKFMAILCYLGILIVVPFLVAKESKFVKFHINQGLCLIVLAIILAVVGCFPLIGGVVEWIGGLVCLILMLMGILNAARGEAKELPLIGRFSLYK